jgi:predicted NBD/HSP70 family sugar kinase
MRIGIDLGGTKIAAGVVSNGRIIRRKVIPTNPGAGKTEILKRMRQLIEELEGGKRMDVGIGVPGSYKGTRIVTLANLPMLNGVDLAQALGRKVNLRNDARCFTLAEHTFGAGKGSRHMVGITLGTGVGGGLIINGKLYLGSGAAGEIGHIMIDDSISKFELGKKGDWEALLSGPALVRRHKEHGGKEKDPASIWASKSAAAKRTRAETIRLLALFIVSLQWTLDPQVIVLGGGLSHLPLVSAVNSYLPKLRGKQNVIKAKLGVDAGILGAVMQV